MFKPKEKTMKILSTTARFALVAATIALGGASLVQAADGMTSDGTQSLSAADWIRLNASGGSGLSAK